VVYFGPRRQGNKIITFIPSHWKWTFDLWSSAGGDPIVERGLRPALPLRVDFRPRQPPASSARRGPSGRKGQSLQEILPPGVCQDLTKNWYL
jgi:hypothetical protein